MVEILLPPDSFDFLGRVLVPADDAIVMEDGFDGLKSLYRTADDASVSFVTKIKYKGDDKPTDTRLVMSLPEFISYNMNDGRENPNLLSKEEILSLVQLGFDPTRIEQSILLAIDSNNRRNKKWA